MHEILYRQRTCKELWPEDTIQYIRTILHRLNIFLMEVGKKSKISNTYSYRFLVASQRLDSLDIGTNGKGMSALYALASA